MLEDTRRRPGCCQDVKCTPTASGVRCRMSDVRAGIGVGVGVSVSVSVSISVLAVDQDVGWLASWLAGLPAKRRHQQNT